MNDDMRYTAVIDSSNLACLQIRKPIEYIMTAHLNGALIIRNSRGELEPDNSMRAVCMELYGDIERGEFNDLLDHLVNAYIFVVVTVVITLISRLTSIFIRISRTISRQFPDKIVFMVDPEPADEIMQPEGIEEAIARRLDEANALPIPSPVQLEPEQIKISDKPQAHDRSIERITVKADIHTDPTAKQQSPQSSPARPITFAKIRDADAIELVSSEVIKSNDLTSANTSVAAMKLPIESADASNQPVASVIEVNTGRSKQPSSQQDMSTYFDIEIDHTPLDDNNAVNKVDNDADDDGIEVPVPSTTQHDKGKMGPPKKPPPRAKAKMPKTPKVAAPRKPRQKANAKSAVVSTSNADLGPFAFVDDDIDGRRRSPRDATKKSTAKIKETVETMKNANKLVRQAQKEAAAERASKKQPAKRNRNTSGATETSASTIVATPSQPPMARKRKIFDPVAYNLSIAEDAENVPELSAPSPPKRRTLQRPRESDDCTTASYDSDAMRSSQNQLQRAATNVQRMNAAHSSRSMSNALQPMNSNVSEFDRLRADVPVRRSTYSYRQAARTVTTMTTVTSQQVLPFNEVEV